MMPNKYVSPPIPLKLGPKGRSFRRADLEFQGVEHAGPSYEARVFLNNPEADEHTPTTPEHGYAGSFHVYGTGLWPEDEGIRSSADEAVDPGTKTLIATEAIRRVAAQGPEVKVTVVPVVTGMAEGLEKAEHRDLLKLAGVSVKIYNQ